MLSRIALVGALALALAGGDAARAQCDVTPPAGAIQTTDGCGISPDSNGGCNVSPAAFTNIGTLSAGATLSVVGEFGTFDANGDPANTEARDIDWMLLTTPVAGKLRLSLAARNSANLPQAATVIYVAANISTSNPCPASFDLAVQNAACPNQQQVYVGAGTHIIAVSTPFDAPGSVANRCGPYRLTLTLDPLANAACGSATAPCVVPHSGAGCDNIGCCERVCGLNPLCCTAQWDAACATLAVSQCGLFLYECGSPAGAPPNDCATNPRLVDVGETGVVVANANAGSDGPGASVGLCDIPLGKDLWYLIQAPGNGALIVSMCGSATIGDSVMEAYGLGINPIVDADRAQTLPDLFIGCFDDTCGTTQGTETMRLVDVVEGEYYLIRIGGWYDRTAGGPETARTFTHTLVTRFERSVYTTGPQQSTLSNGATNNLGVSSGCLSPSQPQRWLAIPWSVPPFPGATSWNISTITAKGWIPPPPSGSPPYTNETLHFIIWSRSGSARPTDGDQRASGFVAYPTPYDNPADSAVDASHDIATNINLPPGDYYLTVYASNSSCGTVASNFAWFVMAPAGIDLVDTQGAYHWRSATFPAPGFVRSTLSPQNSVPPGFNPNDLYNCAFDVFGTPNVVQCAGDINRDQQVDGLDLTILLAGWGSPAADLNGDGTTDGVDLTALLAAWGPCP
jgi:hypothetical protein